MAEDFIRQAAVNIQALAKAQGPQSGFQALLDRGYLESVDDTLKWLPTGMQVSP